MEAYGDPAIERLLRRVGHELATRDVTEIQAKGSNDVVSALDLWAESEIVTHLRRYHPDDAILSEESASSVRYDDRLWVLDPLDGTVNRTSGIPLFAVSLALLVSGTPELAYVYDPVHDELFAAVRGRGALLNGATIRATATGVRGVALTSNVVRQLALHRPTELADFLNFRGKLRNLGTHALHLCYVAAGRLAAVASNDTKLWDNAAGALMVLEAGGWYGTLAGSPAFPLAHDSPALAGGVTSCLAATPETFDQLASLMSGLPEA